LELRVLKMLSSSAFIHEKKSIIVEIFEEKKREKIMPKKIVS